MKVLLLAFALLATLANAAKVDYTGHKVIRVVPQTEEQFRFLLKLQEQAYDFWSSPTSFGSPVDIRVSPQRYQHLASTLNKVGLTHKIRFFDIGKLIEEEERNIILRRALHSGRAFDFENYHTYTEIEAFVNELAATNALVSSSVIGTTYEGRGIIMATVSTGSSSTKPVMYFECAMHAREWIAPATCLYIMNEMATKYGTDAEITAMLDYADWLITPVSNPDGYDYTWTTDRLWRKNRVPNGGICYGTDPNRNFDAGFAGPGASDNGCSDTYHGPFAFSTEEASAMRDAILANSGRVVAAISIHSYSQLWMSPYGYQSVLPADYAEMYRVMTISVNALTATYGTQFQYGNIADTIYPASGGSVDWTYDAENVVYSYALELRDTGLYGFELPPRLILPTATETFNGLKAMAQEIAAKLP
ncbi:carboxypeptidase B [Daphnia magna]|uniref:Zinc carboxypeptidase A 1 n=1 Tax=Daphnia magna TaxID=35525 RepID=A0A164KJJ2_9CRUS|nr:carboxypeptidase B [Daphnia magna]KZS03319.1 Carboxypeptidase A4 [Daphnia magna]